MAKFHEIFAADVDPDLAKILAVGQRPLAAAAFTEKASAAAWKSKPAWGSVASNDLCINPDVERFGYQRGGVTSIEIPSSHLVMLSHPKEVADLIRTAVAGS
ncbi:MAG TPA: alpha/beta fold hydrolase [Trebonia sp.]